MLERASVLAELDRGLAAAADGRGRCVLIEGAAGLGKTRVLAAARQAATAAGFQVKTARGSELERGFAFGVVRQMFEPLLAAMPAADRDLVLSGAASGAGVVTGASAPTTDRPPGDFASLHALYWLTANLCALRPTVLICDDLHWADEPSLRFLTFLLPRLEDMNLLLVAATRPRQQGATGELLARLVADASCLSVPLPPLSPSASGTLIEASLGRPGDPEFLAACHSATGGNPLFLSELAVAARTNDLAPTAENTAQVNGVGAEALGRRVESWLVRMPADCGALARAISVLGGEAVLSVAATVAKLELSAALAAADTLERHELLERASADGVRFVHPLVNTAVYESQSTSVRAAGHRRAAVTLFYARVSPERVAAHLLRMLPAGQTIVVEELRRAARDALARGAPESALRYLRRALSEPPDAEDEHEILLAAADVAAAVDLPAAADLYTSALERCTDPDERASIGHRLARARYYVGRFTGSWDAAAAALECAPTDDLRGRIAAGMISLCVAGAYHAPDRDERIAGWLAQERGGDPGSRMLDAALSAAVAMTGDPAAVALAERALDDPVLTEVSAGDTAQICAWWTLIAADHDLAMTNLDAVLARAHQIGSYYALGAALTWRGLAWLYRGDLAEAITDLDDAMTAADTARIGLAGAFTGPWLTIATVERGDLDAAEAALTWTGAPQPLPPDGPWHLLLEARARLLRARHRPEEALRSALAAGECFARIGGVNPAVVGWRSEAALALRSLGRERDGRKLAQEDLEAARRWGAPRALGRALWVAGLLTEGPAGLQYAADAVDVLGSAKLERAKALGVLGIRQRQAGLVTDARHTLRRGMDLAATLGAVPLAERLGAELRASGGRPRRTALSGPAALTVSERRVADLAADGHTNREIAQRLFVTPKTVEVHLSACYRKLAISRRDELSAALAP
ncbi:helix-turn-helix transcriptional regulator [Cryptosporangium sp. NPDC051539]|uniref:helix-turn-helix transcriptional regulator n=1 Tax=Cryptosporangium sp. NPDC051539 TaxID=3363962 RepID=UPI0037AC7B3E